MRKTDATTPTLALLCALALAVPVGAQIPPPDDVAAPPADAEVTDSGLASKVLRPGAGSEHPSAAAVVQVHYTGWTADGEMFDSSVARGEPVGLPLDRVIEGWTEGVQLMVEGEKRRLWIPEALAYQGRENRPAGMLVFDIELLGFREPPQAPPAPDDVAAAPSDASYTRGGVAYKVLKPGQGGKSPRPSSTVRVNYTGWTTDGQMFDSSVPTGEPATFPLNMLIEGWWQGMQTMTRGEVRRLWIPQRLAYRGQQGKPKGILVFDVELVDFY